MEQCAHHVESSMPSCDDVNKSSHSASLPARPTAPLTTPLTRTRLHLPTESAPHRSSRRSTSMELSLPPSPSTRTSQPTRVESTAINLERPSVVTPSSSSAGEPKVVKTTGSLSTPGTTPGETREHSRSSRVTAELTTKSTPVMHEAQQLSFVT